MTDEKPADIKVDATITQAPTAPVTTKTTEPAQSTVNIDLPEKKTLWRRVFAMVFTLVVDGLIFYLIGRTHDAGTLKSIGLWLIGYNALLAMFYLGGATMTDIGRLVTAVKTSRKETVTTTGGA